ncbi:MAG: 3-dehydroquinate synthase [Gemmatimonadota bacterium]|jgi:3-dehydroquinate synthase
MTHAHGEIVRLDLGAREGYDVVVEPGVLARLADIVGAEAPASHYAIIADATVADLYGATVRRRFQEQDLPADLFTFPAGEANKTRTTWSALTDDMLAHGIGRDACVVALGGGVTGDVAGFVASTYMRGVPVVQVPTSLLAMIDAAIGGKTGLDVPAGKNLVGAFHQPRLVVVDPELLHTLPAAELRSGCAEAIKHGAIADARYLSWLESNAGAVLAGELAALQTLVVRSVRIKAAFVTEDVREAGARSALNFGHTLGHALEVALEYGIAHGRAVAVGMVLEAELGERIGVTAPGTARRLAAVVRTFDLPADPPPNVDPDAVLSATRLDKKARAGQARYTLLAKPGVVARSADDWTHAVDDARVRLVLGGGSAA